MTTVVLDPKAAATPIGELLKSATDSLIELRSPAGKLVAKLVLTGDSGGDCDELLADAERNIAELRRRRATDPTTDLTTSQLLTHLSSLAAE